MMLVVVLRRFGVDGKLHNIIRFSFCFGGDRFVRRDVFQIIEVRSIVDSGRYWYGRCFQRGVRYLATQS